MSILIAWGRSNWQARKARVKERIKEATEELMKVAAARALKQAEEIMPPEGCTRSSPLASPIRDRGSAACDCGCHGGPRERQADGPTGVRDVGFGKTEVALRAAFVVAMTGKQVAVVVPTTLLARQHYANFRERFAESAATHRAAFSPRVVQGRGRADLKAGKLDIVIRTHALLAGSVSSRTWAYWLSMKSSISASSKSASRRCVRTSMF